MKQLLLVLLATAGGLMGTPHHAASEVDASSVETRTATTSPDRGVSGSTYPPSTGEIGYDNVILLGVYPSRPIETLTARVTADAYGPDDAYCTWFGPGSPGTSFHGEKTFHFETLPNGELTRSQAVLRCEYYTHEPNGPLTEYDFAVEGLDARDSAGKPVPTGLCMLDYDRWSLPLPGPNDCRYACGDAVCDGGEPLGSDALATLRAAVQISSCDPEICDVNGSGTITAADAVLVLRSAVGIRQPLMCSQPPYCL